MREHIQHVIFDHYSELIRSGQLIEGDPLPPLAHESEVWGVSAITVSKARKRLRAAGLIERGYGKGRPARVAPEWSW
ncbi:MULTISPECIES: GntR family transcriptional regulator [unclassified Streptomyces]|uniref:GntR family transcriptional regulator n=1 Tax=unclassified Streptomyces TaxID=2593676 RepID=UPI0036EF0709